MKLLNEFKTFAMRGNVIDMAVGVIIGGAFGKIVSSLVNDVVMPPLGVLIGGVDFKDLAITLKKAVVDADGIETAPAVTLNYGMFLQNTFDFLIIAFVIFLMVKGLNTLMKKKKETPAPAPVSAAPAPAVVPAAEEEKVLTDDLELVAVIAAAIAASENTSPDSFVVRSIRKSKKNNWR